MSSCIHAYMRTCIHSLMNRCIGAQVCKCMYTCIQAEIHSVQVYICNQNSWTVWESFHTHYWLPEGEYVLGHAHPLVTRAAGLSHYPGNGTWPVDKSFTCQNQCTMMNIQGNGLPKGKSKLDGVKSTLIKMSNHVIFWGSPACLVLLRPVPSRSKNVEQSAETACKVRGVHPWLEYMLAIQLTQKRSFPLTLW